MNSKLFFVLAAVVVLFNSCKNDLKILAPYKETVSVYALLNPQENRQYVRINKIFLGEGNAYEMAQVADSVNYKSGDLTVTLEREYYGSPALTTIGNATKMQIVLKDTVIQTASGAFNSTQRLFYTDDKLFTSGDYKLKIKNNHTGNEFTAKSTIIDSVKPTLFYSPICPPYYPVPYASSNPTSYYIDYSLPSVSRTIRFFSIPNARDYAVIMRFHYADSLASGSVVPKYFDMDLSTVSANELTGGELLQVDFYMSAFYAKLVAELNANAPANLLFRKAIKMDFIITAITQDFSDFLKVSAPSTSVAQDKPIYTNIEGGGFGIFSARSRLHISKHLASNFIDYMATTKPICNLRFLNSAGLPSSICN